MDNLNIYIHAPLIEECRTGNSRAQFRLYNQYSRAMYSLAYRILNNREDAEDVLQEAFVECFRNLDTFRFESTFGAWLKRIVVNRCINQVKKKRADLEYTETLPAVAEEQEDEPVYDTREIIKRIAELPDGYRIVLTLYLLEGYDHSEIAQILGISESTSKSQYSRAKDKLKSLLSNKIYHG